ncbi:hypothetical protein WR25_16728 [Diploscapter pachys]|uniref:Uncharacterized protein n=1 Tax=Diploscapter pachys TaxID=2018661 RepID=A0A2A2JKX4_9BILA|nr:hypothetical protein WR25_16728 [Diploscapter pachys]
MSTPWLKNFCGFRTTDFEMMQMPHPNIEFGIHVTIRSTQIGAIVGSLVGPASAFLLQGKTDHKSLTNAFVDGGLRGAFWGVVFGPIWTFLQVRNMNNIQLYDKCYRMRFNKSQLFHDRACILSGTVGALTNGQLGFVVGLDLAAALSTILGKTWL